MNRKEFIKLGTLGAVSLTFRPSAHAVSPTRKSNITFGVITDLHHDIMHDGQKRLEAFLGDMKEQQPDFIIQLGDFCVPKPANQPLLDAWNTFSGDKHHVIGNHDTDGGFSKDQVVEFWEAKGNYYSFDKNGFHFVVLDGNEHNESSDRPKGYARYISPSQMDWLVDDLQKTNLPSIVCCHQGLDNERYGIENGMAVRYLLETANTNAGFQKVILVLSGHHHQDYFNKINDIHYVQINSASYYWLGDQYKTVRYSEQVDENYPWIKYTAPYKDPLWATITIASNGKINIKGKKSSFVGPSPKQMGVADNKDVYPIVPYISTRKLS
ncbi:alkaline phosphatase [Echinicola strongylocentroti]|uniref:Alkaline phosphatase n=1 Tax=Echinicola strongylocentroti TaxID=1795355 RepID=A0A2Z4IMS8_9BACT|nr:metallophosphoesterase [Echinicola strongylocentroti]AWW32205.1 alkaline phosphatase [Echinicola strongylocentroti]